jgi:LuxR family maltose regulon positive regulatory protein
LLEILALRALALYRQGDTTQALLTLSQALTMAEPEGYVRVFVDEGLPMAALLRRASSQGIAPNYVSKLLDAFETTQDEKEEADFHPSSIAQGVQPLIEPLTQREREVLRLMATGRSNPEIATELVIAVTTVKTHVKNIYGKLNVDNRFQAVAHAQELNLL